MGQPTMCVDFFLRKNDDNIYIPLLAQFTVQGCVFYQGHDGVAKGGRPPPSFDTFLNEGTSDWPRVFILSVHVATVTAKIVTKSRDCSSSTAREGFRELCTPAKRRSM